MISSSENSTAGSRLDCMFIENGKAETLWTRFPFFPLERAAVALRQLTATHGAPLAVKLAYADRYGNTVSTRDITDQVLAVPAAVVDRQERLEAQQTPFTQFRSHFQGLGRPAAT